ncbi:hypothetical protein [Nocardia sp. NPDC006630]|uniref:hypothetical protein n=1 Tax=Nocardia sp. NPDC006630 TaxID=3157181 RepID=UPI0033A31BE3
MVTALATAVLLTGTIGFAQADDPAPPPPAEPAVAAPPLTSAPAPGPAPAAPSSAPPVAPVTPVAPDQPAPVTTTPSAEPAPPAPVSPAPSTAPNTQKPWSTVFLLTSMPNSWENIGNPQPALEIWADGRAIERRNGQEIYGKVAAEVTTAAAAEVRSLALADMGTATLTDQGAAIIDFMPAPPDQDVHLVVYSPGALDGLTDDQKACRQRFTEVFQCLLNAFVVST